MKVRPLTQETLVAELVSRISSSSGRTRVIIDGAPGAAPGAVADVLVEPVRAWAGP